MDLERIVSLHDLEALAARAIEPVFADYVAQGAWDELTLAENVAAWRRRTLRPRVLVDVARTTTATTLLGANSALPLAIAPVAAHGEVHPEGELATARAAAAAGVPYIHSTFASRPLEAVAAAAPDATRWYQLYAQSDRGRTRELVERAAAAGFGALVVTVDLPVLGYRERDLRNLYDVPDPTRSALDLPDADGIKPLLPDPPPPSLTWADLETLRSWAPRLPLVLKGIMTAEDARLAVEHGADAIVVSNHGGRQLDRVAATADLLEEVTDAVGGRTEVWVDGGVRRGLDIAIALALGARGVLLGRPCCGRSRSAARRASSGRWRSCARSSRSRSRCSARRRRMRSRGRTSGRSGERRVRPRRVGDLLRRERGRLGRARRARLRRGVDQRRADPPVRRIARAGARHRAAAAQRRAALPARALPGQSHTALGLELLVVALVFLGLILAQKRTGDDERRVARLALMLAGTVPPVIGAASLLAEPGGGLYWVAAGMLVAIFGGVVNGWVLLVEILR